MRWSEADYAAHLAKHGQVLTDHPQPSEKAFLGAVVRLAQEHGWLAYHPFDSRRSLPGYPDLTLVRGEQCIWSELKVPGGVLTLKQWRWMQALGAVTRTEAHVWTPDDLPLIAERLRP